MSGVEWFDDSQAINPFMDSSHAVDVPMARSEHNAIKDALQHAGVQVISVDAPTHCQDGVYTANWALVRGNEAILSRLPNARKAEEAYAEKVLRDLGKTIYKPPHGLRFSGQGDALPCGEYLFAGSGYRTDLAVHDFIAKTLNYRVISLQTIPQTNQFGKPVINPVSGWPDSFFYDIDLALAVLRPPDGKQKGLIAWCPAAFMPASRTKIQRLEMVEKIEVSIQEAKSAFACNVVSTGHTVLMSAQAPQLRAELEKHGFKVVTLPIFELAKGGGYIRCTTLTLDNP